MMGGAAAGLTFEFELEDLTKACLGGENKSQSWEISSFQCHIDSVQLTSELTTSFAETLQAGESILIPHMASTCDVQYLQPGGKYTLSLAKQMSRLANVFVSLGVLDSDGDVHKKEMNNFISVEKPKFLARMSLRHISR